MRAKESLNRNLMQLSQQLLDLVSVSKKQAKASYWFFSGTKVAKILKTICACQEKYWLNFLGLPKQYLNLWHNPFNSQKPGSSQNRLTASGRTTVRSLSHGLSDRLKAVYRCLNRALKGWPSWQLILRKTKNYLNSEKKLFSQCLYVRSVYFFVINYLLSSQANNFCLF